MKTDPVKNDNPLKMIDGSAVMNMTTAMTPRMNVGTTDATAADGAEHAVPEGQLACSLSAMPCAAGFDLAGSRTDHRHELVSVLTGDSGDLRLDGGEHGGGNGGLQAHEVFLCEERRG